MATATKTKRGHKAPCIRCGEENTVRLDLGDLESCSFSCSSCDNEFTAAEVRELMAEWTRVLNWIEAVPLG